MFCRGGVAVKETTAKYTTSHCRGCVHLIFLKCSYVAQASWTAHVVIRLAPMIISCQPTPEDTMPQGRTNLDQPDFGSGKVPGNSAFSWSALLKTKATFRTTRLRSFALKSFLRSVMDRTRVRMRWLRRSPIFNDVEGVWKNSNIQSGSFKNWNPKMFLVSWRVSPTCTWRLWCPLPLSIVPDHHHHHHHHCCHPGHPWQNCQDHPHLSSHLSRPLPLVSYSKSWGSGKRT